MFNIPAPAAVNLELLYVILYLSTPLTVADVGTVDLLLGLWSCVCATE